MRLRKQDANGDMQFGHSAADFWHDQVEGVAQSVKTRLMLFRGEWFLDVQEGTPWGGFPINQQVVDQGQILGAHTQATRDAALFQRVLQTPGVLSILDYASQTDPITRRFSAQMTIDTQFGAFQIAAQPTPYERPYFILDWSPLGSEDPL